MKTSIVVVLAILFAGCAKEEDAGSVEFKLGKHVLHVPEENSMEGQQPFWLRWVGGLDDSTRSSSLVISEQELVANVQGYQVTGVDMHATLSALTDVEIQRYQDAQRYADQWFGVGDYRGQRVEAIGTLYRVFRPNERNAWIVVKLIPDPTQQLPRNPLDFYVARCTEYGSSVGDARCQTYVLVGDLALDFYISERNLPLVDQVRAFLEMKLRSWTRT
jgi:hypothetical protein